MLEKHRALGQLAATTAGAYNDNNQLLSGVLLKVKIGKYLDNEYAILDNISYDIPDDSSWDIDEKLAMYLKVNISLTIIYKNLPQYKKNEGFFKQLRDTNPSFLNPNYKTVLASTNPNSNNTTPNSNNTTPNPIDPTLLRDLINPLNRN